MAEIASAKRHRGMVRARLTWMEKDMGKLEEKEELTPSDGKKVRRLKELAKEHDREFKEHHVEVLNIIVAEDTAAWKWKKLFQWTCGSCHGIHRTVRITGGPCRDYRACDASRI